MLTRSALTMTGLLFAVIGASATAVVSDSEPTEPPVVTPGAIETRGAPSDATVLFDGKDLSRWATMDGKPAGWASDGTAMTVTTGAGSIVTRDKFADCQLHIEFATPAKVEGEGQGRGNSGVYLQGRYEVQVLDSYNSRTYPDGQCGAIYKQHPPLVNACRAPGEWQTYDIVFRAPRFDGAGRKTANASLTVVHNGVLIQDHADVTGPTGSAPFKESPDPGPLYLQDHGNPVRYRNIWIRPLAPSKP